MDSTVYTRAQYTVCIGLNVYCYLNCLSWLGLRHK